MCPSSVQQAAPAVCVLMPVYNAQRYLRQAIDSILAQTFTDFEFIIIDDGSRDRSLEIVRQYQARDPRITVLSRPNTGIVGALNDGLGMARAELIARMDGDDIALPQRLQRQVVYMAAHPQCVAVGSRVLLVDARGRPICRRCHQTTHEEIDAAHLRAQWPMVHPAVMMRTRIVRELGGYRPQYNTLEDLDLFCRMAERGRLANIPEVLLHYRQHFANTCLSRSEEQNQVRRQLYQELYRRRQLPLDTSLPLSAPPVRRARQHLLWAWWALASGYLGTARRHAAAALCCSPLSADSWRAVHCALRGY